MVPASARSRAVFHLAPQDASRPARAGHVPLSEVIAASHHVDTLSLLVRRPALDAELGPSDEIGADGAALEALVHMHFTGALACSAFYDHLSRVRAEAARVADEEALGPTPGPAWEDPPPRGMPTPREQPTRAKRMPRDKPSPRGANGAPPRGAPRTPAPTTPVWYDGVARAICGACGPGSTAPSCAQSGSGAAKGGVNGRVKAAPSDAPAALGALSALSPGDGGLDADGWARSPGWL